jgi:hypothetical protein
LYRPPTSAWHAVRFGILRFGVFVAFTNRAGQEAHIGDQVAKVLREQAADLLTATPTVEGFDLLASSIAGPVPGVAEGTETQSR